MNNIYLSNSRLQLRNLIYEDIDPIIKLASDFSIADMMNGSIPHPYTAEDASKWIDKHKNDSINSKNLSFSITLEGSHVFIGSIQLNVDKENHTARLSYWIGKPYWNKGYATEAVKLLLSFAFNEIKLTTVFADHFERNQASKAVLLKCGFVNFETIDHQEGLQNRFEILKKYKLERDSFES